MILILFVITAAGAMAQVVSSTLAGTVRDQSSALVSARHDHGAFTSLPAFYANDSQFGRRSIFRSTCWLPEATPSRSIIGHSAP